MPPSSRSSLQFVNHTCNCILSWLVTFPAIKGAFKNADNHGTLVFRNHYLTAQDKRVIAHILAASSANGNLFAADDLLFPPPLKFIMGAQIDAVSDTHGITVVAASNVSGRPINSGPLVMLWPSL